MVDPMADTIRFDALCETQPIAMPIPRAAFDRDDAQWFDDGERSAEQEWANLAQRTRSCPNVPLALAFAGSAALGILLAVAF